MASGICPLRWTTDPGFPTTAGSYDTSFNGIGDCFVARLSRSGTTLMDSTFVGAPDADEASGVAMMPTVACVAGSTQSVGFPVTRTGQTMTDSEDAFLFVLFPQWNALE